MTEAEEREFIAASLDGVERASGRRAAGWIGQDYRASRRARRTCSPRPGSDYLVDWPNDDQPYLMARRPIVSIPNQAEWDDVQLMWHRRVLSPRYPADRHARRATGSPPKPRARIRPLHGAASASLAVRNAASLSACGARDRGVRRDAGALARDRRRGRASRRAAASSEIRIARAGELRRERIQDDLDQWPARLRLSRGLAEGRSRARPASDRCRRRQHRSRARTISVPGKPLNSRVAMKRDIALMLQRRDVSSAFRWSSAAAAAPAESRTSSSSSTSCASSRASTDITSRWPSSTPSRRRTRVAELLKQGAVRPLRNSPTSTRR